MPTSVPRSDRRSCTQAHRPEAGLPGREPKVLVPAARSPNSDCDRATGADRKISRLERFYIARKARAEVDSAHASQPPSPTTWALKELYMRRFTIALCVAVGLSALVVGSGSIASAS